MKCMEGMHNFNQKLHFRFSFFYWNIFLNVCLQLLCFFPTCLFEILIMSDPRLHLTKGEKQSAWHFGAVFFIEGWKCGQHTPSWSYWKTFACSFVKKKKKTLCLRIKIYLQWINSCISHTHTNKCATNQQVLHPMKAELNRKLLLTLGNFPKIMLM